MPSPSQAPFDQPSSDRTPRPQSPRGFLNLTLHAHLPYVVNHGTWPHGIEWLHEAAAETYLPLLRVLSRLERDGIALHCNLDLSPVLMEQLVHPVFVAEFPNYLTRKIVAAREDEAFFTQSGEPRYAETARYWQRFFTQAQEDFRALQGNIVAGFVHFHQAGLIELITCAATHGYLPLLGTDESVRAQVRTAAHTFTRHTGLAPRGIWVPECGYRPAGDWAYPVAAAPGAAPLPGPFSRIGTEQAVAESSLDFFFVDTHLVEGSHPVATPYPLRSGAPGTSSSTSGTLHKLYQPYLVQDQGRTTAVAVFPRDPETGLQVWSGEVGYPGDGNYLDFHKKRWPGGHRYWRVTGPHVDMNDKAPWLAHDAEARVHAHAAHFVALVREALRSAGTPAAPPILCAPFDAELFGHWWFEGPLWLEAVARLLHADPAGPCLISGSGYLDQHPATEPIAMQEGSWGAEGSNQVWLNPETAWTWSHIYPAEILTRTICSDPRWRDTETGSEIVRQLCRELLLLESSDWQFLITTGAARDYAELRFVTHHDQFQELANLWQDFAYTGSLTEAQAARLAAIRIRDSIFPGLDPALWATGARAGDTSPRAPLPAASLAPAQD